jgi:DNA-binding CsgD family transcriptional regulator
MAQALFDIGWQQFDEMKLDLARKSARESLALARMVESPPAIARALLLDGLAATESDLVEEAIPVLEESLALFREIGDSGNMASAMAILARAEGKRGNDERAKPLLRDAVGLLVQQGNFISLIGPLVALGFMAMHSEVQPDGAYSAAQIFGMMATWGEKLGGTNPWNEEPMRRVIEQVTAILGADAFAQAFEIGKLMTPADLVQLAEQITTPTSQTILPTPPQPAPVHSLLSPRELDVLRLLAQGLTSAQIAEQLVIGVVTVNFHVRSIYSKLGVSSRSAATRYALEHHLE